MQIILVQSEVEQSIREYVAKRMTLADGTQIKIDLAATRGPEGFKATIDLVVGEEGAAPAPAPQKTLGVRQAVAKAKEPAQEPEAPKAADTPAVEEKPAQQASEAPAANPAPEAATPAEEKPAEEAPAARSLFKNLNKPVNS